MRQCQYLLLYTGPDPFKGKDAIMLGGWMGDDGGLLKENIVHITLNFILDGLTIWPHEYESPLGNQYM